MVTRNPARTFRWSRHVGSIARGKVADLIVVSGRSRSPYRSLVDATERDVRLTLVGGDPLAGDPRLMGRLKAKRLQTVHSSRGRFAKAIDVTKGGIAKGSQHISQIESRLRAALSALGGADRFAYLKSRVGFGAFANVTDGEFRTSYLEPTFGLRADGSLNAEAIALSPLMPWDDEARFGLIEGRSEGLPYPTNVNHIPVTGPNPFAGFEQRWYARPDRTSARRRPADGPQTRRVLLLAARARLAADLPACFAHGRPTRRPTSGCPRRCPRRASPCRARFRPPLACLVPAAFVPAACDLVRC